MREGDPPRTDRVPRRVDVPLAPERDVDRELAFHLEETRRALMAAGWPPDAARDEAERRFGDHGGVRAACVQLVREHRQQRRRAQMFEDLINDLRFAIRMLLRRPRAAVLAVLTMGLGIGAVSALFTLVYQVVLAPLPYAGSSAIVDLAEGSENGRPMPVSALNYADWHTQATSFSAMAAHNGGGTTLVRGLETPLRAEVAAVSGEFFQVFAAQPRVGRLFTDAEPLENGSVPAVVSEGFWRRQLRAEPSEALARRGLEVWGEPVTVIGVVPAGFDYPEATEIWVAYDEDPAATGRTAHNWHVVARLAEGRDLAHADAEMDTIAGRLAIDHEGDNDAVSVITRPLRDVMVGPIQRPLFLLLAASGLLLLLACANLTSALMARSAARAQELAVRAALGAGRRRIVRQLLCETVLLHVLGALAGVGAAHVAVRTLIALRPSELVRLDEVGVDLGVLLFGLAVAVITGLVFGLAPARSGSRLAGALGSGGRRTDDARKSRVFDVLIAAEAMLAFVLLIGAALLLRSFLSLTAVEFGFRTDKVLVVDLLPPPADVSVWSQGPEIDAAEQKHVRFLEGALEAVGAVAGAESVGLVSHLPLSGRGPHGLLCVDHPERTVHGQYRVVGGDYFGAMGIPIQAGRAFDARDRFDGQPVVVVSARLAADAWPDGDAIGKQLCTYGMDRQGATMATVVGVVGDVRHHGPTEPPRPTVYVALAQRGLRAASPALVVRTASDPTVMTGAVRSVLGDAAPGMPVAVSTFESVLSGFLAPRRFSLFLVAVFAIVALALAATGIYGVVTYSVSRRRTEVGIRMALGAKPGAVLRALIGRTLGLVALGLVAGALVAFALGRVVASTVEGIGGADLSTMAATAATMIAVALFACWLPARRALGVEPTVALRTE